MVKRKEPASPGDEGPSTTKPRSVKKPKIPSSKKKAVEKKGSSDEEQEPLAKSKSKSAKKVSPSNEEDDDGSAEAPSIQKNYEGDQYIELAKKRRVTVRSFKGTTYVDIREFYGDAGDEKPGKKGISLSVEQWQTLVQSASIVDTMVKRAK